MFGLLLSPEVADPLDSTLALSFYEADGTYEVSPPCIKRVRELQKCARRFHMYSLA